ncbi:MAG: cardiolipin synthase [Sarcina sp.]
MHGLLITALVLIGLIDFIFIVILVFFERKDVTSTWAWLLILIFIPLIGVILYLLLGQGISKRKRFKKKNSDDNVKNEYLKKIEMDNDYNMSSEVNKDFIIMNYLNCNALYTRNNILDFFFDGKELYNDILDELSTAKDFIHMQFYIFRSDSWGSKILDVLCEKASKGVEVKLQVDGMGNFIDKKYIKKLEAAGGKFEVFFPSILKKINLRANYRNHRKFIVIDGKTAYLGGFNIGKEYAGEGKLGYWRDTHFKIKGAAVNAIEARFILDWTYTSKETLSDSFKKYFNKHEEIVDRDTVPLQIISSGPDHEKEHIKNNYMKIINRATKRICIQTPYLVPDNAILDSLKIAALSGVEVNIMLPGQPDHFFIPWVANNYIRILLEYGVNIYKYDAKGFIHAKTMVADSIIASAGTANMDLRSFSLNFETNAVIYSSKKAIELEKKFDEDLKICTRLTKEEFNARSKKTKFLESIFRLLSPIM